MFEALAWGLLAAASLLLGALLAARRPPHKRTLGLIMAFGSGVLVSAVSFELIEEAADMGGNTASILVGLLTGAAVFTFGDILIGRFERRRRGQPMLEPGGEAGGLPILLGALLDGVPETAVLGLSVLQTGGVGRAMMAAVFISNLPEGIAATTALIEAGWRRSTVVGIWSAVVALCALAAGLGYALLDGASIDLLAFVYSFSGGAVLTMLAISMIPEAYERAGRPVGFVTAAGFIAAYAVHLSDG
ncbi:MAG: ZIP family metal transporter [Acidimicrobiia bacterium]